MSHPRSLLRSLVVLAAIAVGSACSCGGPQYGAATVTVALHNSAAAVTSVRVTLTGENIVPAMTLNLTNDGTQWTGTITDIPAGANRTFTAEAFDAANVVLYRGEATGVQIEANVTAFVAIIAQEVNPDPGFENNAPRIDSLTSSHSRVMTGRTASFVAQASDPDGDALTYQWTASAGTLSAPNALTTQWTAPATEGPVTISFTARDPELAEASASFTLLVENRIGAAAVTVSFNTWPVVERITASPSQVAPLQPTTVAANVIDLDADALSYAWSSGCAGTFGTPTAVSTTFTPDTGVSGACTVALVVTDARGGSTTGSLGIEVTTPPAPNYGPSIELVSVSSYDPGPNGSSNLFVQASDPEGQPLTFFWLVEGGTLSGITDTATTSSGTFTLPACMPAGLTAHAQVTVTDTASLSVQRDFPFPNLPTCP